MMKLMNIPPPGREPRLERNARQLILVRITNLNEFLAAYGASASLEIASFINVQLETIGIRQSAVALEWPYVFIDPEACRDVGFSCRDAFCERINAVLSFGPVMCAEEEAFLRVETTFIDAKDKCVYTGSEYESSRLHGKAWTGRGPDGPNKQGNAYKADMARALGLFSKLSARTLVLAFQPVVSTQNKSLTIYWECLLRHWEDSSPSGFTTCAISITALERLGLVGRIDRSILWSTFDVLAKHPEISLGCNISAQSLQFDCWWRLVFEALLAQPGVASRLVIEITETSAISQDDEAIALLQTLKTLGCKIAVDDMGSGYSTLDFVVRSRPDFVKIDKAYLDPAMNERIPSSQSILRNLTQLCANLSPCVITEGIESERDLADAVEAGTHALQGYLLGRPYVVPYWLNGPIVVRDAFEMGHPSHALSAPDIH